MAKFIRSLSRKLLYDRLHEISDRVYVFECCLSRNELSESDYKTYMDAAVANLHKYHPGAAYMVFNFREGHSQSFLSEMLSQHDMTVVDYPLHYEGYPLLPLEMIHHFLRSSSQWLSLEGQGNVILLHCEQRGWPVLAFMLSGLLLYTQKCTGEQKTLEMVYNKAAKELLTQFSSINPRPSQLRYLKYISERSLATNWPPSVGPLVIDSLVLMNLPLLDGGKGCRPVILTYGQDTAIKPNRSPRLLFSSLSTGEAIRYYHKEECSRVILDINRHVKGDVYLECIHLGEDLMTQESVFRVMFHTSFVESNILLLRLDDIDVLWDAKSKFPNDFKAEVHFSSFEEPQSNVSKEVPSDEEEEEQKRKNYYESENEFFEVEEFDITDSEDHYYSDNSFSRESSPNDSRHGRRNSLPANYTIEDLGDAAESEIGPFTESSQIMFSVESFKDLRLNDYDVDWDKGANSDASSVENIVIADSTEETTTSNKHVLVFSVSQEPDMELAQEADQHTKQDTDYPTSDIDEFHPDGNNRQISYDYESTEAYETIVTTNNFDDGGDAEEATEAASSEAGSEIHSASKSIFPGEGSKEGDSYKV